MLTASVSPTLQGIWSAPSAPVSSVSLYDALLNFQQPVIALADGRIVQSGAVTIGSGETPHEAQRVLAFSSAFGPQSLGDPAFKRAHGLRYAYVQGAMANGIASEALVEAVSRAGGLGFFGAAGLPPARVAAAIERIQKNLGNAPYGFNFIHSPNEPYLEDEIIDLYLNKGVQRIEAAAFLGLTLPLVRYRVSGIHKNAEGEVITPNHVFAKVSRVEVASKFFAPPPEAMLKTLVEQGHITAEQAAMAATIPVAEDLTAEADSGGHTDNRPALCLVPTMIALRDQMQAKYGYKRPLRVGAAGGVATPLSACAAFAMGAAYIVTGSVNQACQESGSSDLVRQMLTQARQADVMMAPAADMFEMGVNVQVLKFGTLFPVRAKKLYEIYRRYDSLETLPKADLEFIERDLLRCSVTEEWNNTRTFFEQRDPKQVERANREPKHKMALVFRSYLGRASRWANQGLADRKVDYQVWCGPAMGAFNEWTKGTFLETVENRLAETVCHNLLVGAAYLTRLNELRNQGLGIKATTAAFAPLEPEALAKIL